MEAIEDILYIPELRATSVFDWGLYRVVYDSNDLMQQAIAILENPALQRFFVKTLLVGKHNQVMVGIVDKGNTLPCCDTWFFTPAELQMLIYQFAHLYFHEQVVFA